MLVSVSKKLMII